MGSNAVIASGTATVNTAFDQPAANVTSSVLPAALVSVDQLTGGLYKGGTLLWWGSFPVATLFSVVVKSSTTNEEFAVLFSPPPQSFFCI